NAGLRDASDFRVACLEASIARQIDETAVGALALDEKRVAGGGAGESHRGRVDAHVCDSGLGEGRAVEAGRQERQGQEAHGSVSLTVVHGGRRASARREGSALGGLWPNRPTPQR